MSFESRKSGIIPLSVESTPGAGLVRVREQWAFVMRYKVETSPMLAKGAWGRFS
jgi:hypothetical protein